MNKDLEELKRQEDHFKNKEEELSKKERVREHTWSCVITNSGYKFMRGGLAGSSSSSKFGATCQTKVL